MKKSLLSKAYLALLASLLVGQKAQAQPPFVGEKLAVEVTFLRIPVVTATLSVTADALEQGEPLYHLAISAKSTPFYSLLYEVDNHYDSYFTWPEVHTLRYERSIKETGVDLQRMVRYRNGTAYDDGEAGRTVPPGVRDLFSSLYALRGQPLVQDQVIESPLDLDGQLWLTRAVVLAREEVKTPLGSYGAIKVMVNFMRLDEVKQSRRDSDVLTNNLVKSKTKLLLWFSDDERRIPLRAQYRLAPFSLNAVLCALN